MPDAARRLSLAVERDHRVNYVLIPLTYTEINIKLMLV